MNHACGTMTFPALSAGGKAGWKTTMCAAFLPSSAGCCGRTTQRRWKQRCALCGSARKTLSNRHRGPVRDKTGWTLQPCGRLCPRAATPGNGLPVQKHGLPRRKPKSRGSWQSAGHKSMALATQWRNCSTRLCSTHRCLRCWTRLPLGRRQIFAALQARAGRQALCG